MQKIPILLFTPIILVFLSGCERKETIHFSQSGDGIVWFNNAEIQLRFDRQMYCKVFRGKDLSLNDAKAEDLSAKPSHFITIDDEDITSFEIDYDRIECVQITTNFGEGKRLILKGKAAGPKNCTIEKTLTVEMYEAYPNAAISYASYKNSGSTELLINSIYSNYYLLDATLAEAAEEPHEFWSFHGPANHYGEDYVLPLSAGFFQENYMGRKRQFTDNGPPRGTFGGGVPVVDLWTKNAGLGIALVEPLPKLVYMPVEVQTDQKVKVYIRRDFNISLLPGESHQTLKSAVITHTLDYFDCLHTFSQLMDDQGVHMKEPSEASYEPVWCGWGYGFNFTSDDILQTLPKVKELGIPWVVIDDRWYDYSGDWHVRSDLWPGGDEQMIALVDTLHQLGFKAKLWWEPPTVQGKIELKGIKATMNMPGTSDLYKEHPEWLIMDEDGNFPREDRRNYQLCPGLPEVQDYMRQLTVRFISEWGFDGFKYDAFHTVPPCYNPAHNHKRPEESHEELPQMFQTIYETAKSIKPECVIENCHCGTTQDFFQAAWTDQPVVSDPGSSWQVRHRTKLFKALMGSDAPAYSDHIDCSGRGDENYIQTLSERLASAFGTGGVPGTKFTWPEIGDSERFLLTGDKESLYKKWFSMYNRMMLSKGDYLNLYDIAYDKPESHVIRKADTFYYAFYAESWNGDITLRGLEKRHYSVFDYVNQVELGKIKGPEAHIHVDFNDYLLLECTLQQ